MNLRDLWEPMPDVESYQSWGRPAEIKGVVVHHSGPGTVRVDGLLSLTRCPPPCTFGAPRAGQRPASY